MPVKSYVTDSCGSAQSGTLRIVEVGAVTRQIVPPNQCLRDLGPLRPELVLAAITDHRPRDLQATSETVFSLGRCVGFVFATPGAIPAPGRDGTASHCSMSAVRSSLDELSGAVERIAIKITVVLSLYGIQSLRDASSNHYGSTSGPSVKRADTGQSVRRGGWPSGTRETCVGGVLVDQCTGSTIPCPRKTRRWASRVYVGNNDRRCAAVMCSVTPLLLCNGRPRRLSPLCPI